MKVFDTKSVSLDFFGGILITPKQLNIYLEIWPMGIRFIISIIGIGFIDELRGYVGTYNTKK